MKDKKEIWNVLLYSELMPVFAIRELRINDIPKSDVKLFKQLMNKLSCAVSDKEAMLDEYIQSRPENIEISDEEILQELDFVRYSK